MTNLPNYDSWKLSNGETKEDAAFTRWFEQNEKRLEDEFMEQAIISEGLLDDDCPDYISDNYDEFMDWCWEEFQKIGEN